jgi:hypothetical protein
MKLFSDGKSIKAARFVAFFKIGNKLIKIYDDGQDWVFTASDGQRWFTKHSTMGECQSLSIALDKYTDGKKSIIDIEIV